jgi:nitrogenase molybdenum-iron protein alpha/beta subunit
MSCRAFIRTSNDKGKISITELADIIPVDSFFDRGIISDDCGELVNLALCVPGIDVVALGPVSCSRVLYFRAREKGLNERLFSLAVSNNDFATGRHLEKLEEVLEDRLKLGRPSAIIIYITCVDIIIGTDFVHMTERLQKKYGIPVKVFERGPLSRRRTVPKERLRDIFINLLEKAVPIKTKGVRKQINILGYEGVLPAESSLREMLLKVFLPEEVSEFAVLQSYGAFEKIPMGKLNIALDSFGCDLAVKMQEKWDIPFLYLPARYNVTEIEENYSALQNTLQIKWDSGKEAGVFNHLKRDVSTALKNKRVAVGIGDRSFELAHAMEQIGISVAGIFVETVDESDLKYINPLVSMGSQAEVYVVSNMTSEAQENSFSELDIAIGGIASFFCVNAKTVSVGTEYLFGYEGILGILEAINE